MVVVYFVLWFGLLQVVAAQPSTRGDSNGILFGNFIQHEGYRLLGTPLRNITVASFSDCLLECATDTRCLSTNVNTTHDVEGLFECVLLGFDKYEHEENLTAVKEVDHYALPIDPDSPPNCAAISKIKVNTSAVYRIRPSPSRLCYVYCDMVTSGGGWTVIQKRLDGSVDFYRAWADYKKGFGSKLGEYWLGLDNIHALTSRGSYRLRVDLEDFEGNTTYAEYDSFNVADEAHNYNLTIGQYSGNGGDSLRDHHNNMQFSTKDRDNDAVSYACAIAFTGAWWYNTCHASNLNGLYLNGSTKLFAKGVVWSSWKGHYYSLKRVEMKIRPREV
ncbi:hypothetical protein QZH41_001194 [Actinostola sp. cb2023]|nr:hypothetical protein QZH41_001194 [Actinostola sp. cb2023]